ncbi:MAG: Crp/Fnr family transcriptional regulator [Deltaproteobacteria bacterium]|nr:Crp/Fnr family transcriptional regulator [Deltaproteobacteria bacterium]
MTTEGALARFSRELPAGSILFREGERGEEMFVIQSGQVRIVKRVANGDKVLATLGPGEFLGEMAILNSKPRTATAQVTDDGPARVLAIDAKRFEHMIANNREIVLRLIKKLAARLDSADALIEILMHKDPKARVVRALARHAESFGQPTPQGVRVLLDADDLAAQVNVDAAQTADVLSRLRRVRVISVEADGKILVHDLDRLFDFLEFLEMPQKFGGETSA